MQEEDWGKYSQAPWMTGGSWKDTTVSNSLKQSRSKRPARVTTTKHANDFSEDTSNQDDDKFQAEVDLADLKMHLLRWNFARSWGTASSADESRISPRSRPQDVEKTASCSGKSDLFADQAGKNRSGQDGLSGHEVNTIAKTHPPLDESVIGQYLDRCIAVTESQLAGAGSKAKKKGAVKEIERLVEKVMTQASLTGKRVEVGLVSGDVFGTAVRSRRRRDVKDEVVERRKGRRI